MARDKSRLSFRRHFNPAINYLAIEKVWLPREYDTHKNNSNQHTGNMKASNILLLSTVTPFTVAETLVGVYVFHRHGDRTPKSLAPTNLTALGYSQVYEAGTYFRNRYVDSVASSRIAGINADTVKLSQLQVSAPVDNVLMNSAQAFTQALYPALGEEISSQRLRNGTTVRAPLNGYQLIPITEASSGTGAEDSGWLQDASNCGAAKDSSNAYFSSSEYQKTYDDNKDFYERLAPVLNSTFNSTEITYENAYTSMSIVHSTTQACRVVHH